MQEEGSLAKTDAKVRIVATVEADIVADIEIIVVTAETITTTEIDATTVVETTGRTMVTVDAAEKDETAPIVEQDEAVVTNGIVEVVVIDKMDATLATGETVAIEEVTATSVDRVLANSVVAKSAARVAIDAPVKIGVERMAVEMVAESAVHKRTTAARARAQTMRAEVKAIGRPRTKVLPMRTTIFTVLCSPILRSAEQNDEKTRVRHGCRASRCRRDGRSPGSRRRCRSRRPQPHPQAS